MLRKIEFFSSDHADLNPKSSYAPSTPHTNRLQAKQTTQGGFQVILMPKYRRQIFLPVTQERHPV